jgi:hypothetical protein
MRLVGTKPFLAIVVCVSGLAADCSNNPFAVYGAPSRSLSIAVGQEMTIQMGTAGPGEYVSPPTLSGSAIEFLEVTPSSVVEPGGVRQDFHFRGVTTGQTIIVFHNTESVHPDVADTVVVR